MNELKINTNLPNGQFRVPAPPTSPVPQPSTSQASQNKPAAVSLNHNCSLTNTASSFTATNLSNNAPSFSASVYSQLPPLFPVTPRIIWPSQKSDIDDEELNEIRMACSTTMTSRPIIISLANVLRKHESTPNIKYMKSIGTSTDDLNDSPKPKKSKIPRLVNAKFDHRLMSRSLEESQALKKSLKRPPSLGFIPVGKDYVSLIDFSRKDERGWPLDRTL